MLPERICRMLTAYVDGELSDGQRKTVLSLLRRSAKARDLLRRLQSDADCLRHLPRPILGRDVSAQVVKMLDARQAWPSGRRLWASAPGRPAWLGLAAAAAVLLAVGVGSFLYLSGGKPEEAAPSLAVAVPHPQPELQPGSNHDPEPIGDGEPEGAGSAEKTTLPMALQEEQLGPPRAEKPISPPAPPTPKKDPPPPFGSEIEEAPTKLRSADLDVPLMRQVRELDQQKRRQELEDELHKGKPRRLDLMCQDSGVAMERLQTAFAKQGIVLKMDQDAENHLKLRLKADYALVIDRIAPDEVLAIVLQLRGEDREAEKRRGPVQFERFVFSAMNTEDHQSLIQLLGSDPTAPTKGQGGARPEAGKSVARAAERMALVVAYDRNHSRASSPEVKLFLENCKERRSEGMSMLLVLHKTK
jgi:hypothetical protein